MHLVSAWCHYAVDPALMVAILTMAHHNVHRNPRSKPMTALHDAHNYEQITATIDGAVGIITLNRPEKLNSWTSVMRAELAHSCALMDADDAVRAIIITGAGRAFCAGADLSGGAEGGFAPESPASREAVPDKWPFMCRKPVIAAINGHAIGVGLTFPMLADIRVAADDAKLAFAMVRRGILPELASHLTVAQVAGFARAADLLLTGRTVTGAEAAQIGIVSESVPRDEVMPRALAIAQDIAANTAPLSVALSKKLLWESLGQQIAPLMATEGKMIRWLTEQDDVKEGVNSFFERRAPQWTGQPAKELPADWS